MTASVRLTTVGDGRSFPSAAHQWEWEAVGPDGKRLRDSTEFATDVRPGRTATGDSPTTPKTSGVTHNITEFDRGTAW